MTSANCLQSSANLFPRCITEEDREALIRILENTINQLRLMQWLKEDQPVPKNEHRVTDFTLKTLLVFVEELKTRNTFHLLKEIVSNERSKCDQIFTLQNRIKSSKTHYKKLKKLLKEECKQFYKESRILDRIIDEQSNELERLKEQNHIDQEFTKNLLRIQIEENELKCQIEENDLQNRIAAIQEEVKLEEKIRDEVLFYYDNEIRRLSELIAHWKDRQKDIEERKLLLTSLRESQLQQHEELEFYKSLYKSRNDEIEEYLADKERRRKEKEYELYINEMATRIQSWWRGVMVRRCLGPFKHLLKAKNAKKRKMSLKKVVKR